MNYKINLNYLNIYQLRDYARQIGVKSPSNKKRSDLVLAINNVLNGTTKPFFPPAVYKGRPPYNKALTNIKQFTNIEAYENYKKLKIALKKICDELVLILNNL